MRDNVNISKQHPAIQALAAFDELNAWLGICKTQAGFEWSAEFEVIQQNIMKIMSVISAENTESFDFTAEVTALERQIDTLSRMLPDQTEFVTYGRCPQSAAIDTARAVTRRAETLLIQAAEERKHIGSTFVYINRLSDYLYMKARFCDFEHAVTQEVRKVVGQNENKTPAAYGATLFTKEGLTLSHAKAIMTQIEQKSAEMGLNAAIACCDASGNSIAAYSMDNAYFVSFSLAISKAYTAAALKMPTTKVAELVQPGQMFYGLESFEGGKFVPIGGGVPLFGGNGNLLGAVGVSGGTAEQDDKLARFGEEVWRNGTIY